MPRVTSKTIAWSAGSVLAVVFAAFLAAAPVSAGTCPTSGDGVTCFGGESYCPVTRQCYTEPTSCPGNQVLNCSACGCRCPSGTTWCAARNLCTTNQSCPEGFTWDPCAETCSTPYVLLAPSSTQTGGADVSSDIKMGGDLYMTSGKSVRVDGSGQTILNIGNWGDGATGVDVILGGKVGVGMSPVEKVDVSGRVKATGFCIGASCISSWPGSGSISGSGTTNYLPKFTASTTLGNSLLYDSGTGIGVGTTSVGEKLSVAGNVGITGGSLYLPAMTSASPYGAIFKSGTAFLHDFNYGNNGSVTTIGRNFFAGLGAGNFTMGSSAMSSSQASYNVGIGFNALTANTTGYYNTAVGYAAMDTNSTGTYSVAVGANALDANTTGYSNVAVGNYSLWQNTTGYYNTAVGFNALYGGNGSNNLAIAPYSLYSNSSGVSNVALGFNAGYSLVSGVGNVFLGVAADSGSSAASNQIVIGNQAVGLGSNTVVIGNTSITKTALRGDVGIGTTAPAYPLDVVGDIKSSTSLRSSNLYASNYIQAPNIQSTGIIGATGTISSGANVTAGGSMSASGNITSGGYVYGANLSISGTALAGGYYFASDTDTGIYRPATNSLGLAVGGSEAVRVNSSGNVGIGVDGPVSRLHVRAVSSYSTTPILVVDSSGTQVPIDLRVGGTAYGRVRANSTGDIVVAGLGGNVYLRAGDDSSTDLFIAAATGNVGIGTTSPSQKLHVVGDIRLNLSGTATINGVCHSGTDSDSTASGRDLVVCNNTPNDIAEWFETDGTVGPGDIVAATDESIDYQSDEVVARTGEFTGGKLDHRLSVLTGATRSSEGRIVGVISTSPVQAYGRGVLEVAEHAMPSAITGRVPVKVNLEGGAISAGDPITVSSTAGVGMRLNRPGRIIGFALGSWDGPGAQGIVLVQVSIGWHSGGTIAADGTLPVFTSDFAFAEAASATAADTAKASRSLTFRGSWWNAARGAAETLGIMLANRVEPDGRYGLSVTNDSGDEVAFFGSSGDIAVPGNVWGGGSGWVVCPEEGECACPPGSYVTKTRARGAEIYCHGL